MSDRITIINNYDGTVDVMLNGENVEKVPTNNLDSTIHAVQWYGDHGVIEHDDHNEEITDFSKFDIILNERESELDRIAQAALDEEPTESEKDRMQRDSLLAQTDWIVTKYTEIGEPIPQEWKDYRQTLRDITEQDGFPGNVDWPEDPTTTP